MFSILQATYNLTYIVSTSGGVYHLNFTFDVLSSVRSTRLISDRVLSLLANRLKSSNAIIRCLYGDTFQAPELTLLERIAGCLYCRL